MDTWAFMYTINDPRKNRTLLMYKLNPVLGEVYIDFTCITLLLYITLSLWYQSFNSLTNIVDFIDNV